VGQTHRFTSAMSHFDGSNGIAHHNHNVSKSLFRHFLFQLSMLQSRWLQCLRYEAKSFASFLLTEEPLSYH
jgi:hypothetical protein